MGDFNMDKAWHAMRQLAQNTRLTEGLAPRPPGRMEPEGMDLHHLDYKFPKVACKPQGNKLLPEQKQPQLLADSSAPPGKSNLAGSPYASKPSYTGIDSSPVSQHAIESEKSRQADQGSEHVSAAKAPDTRHQAKESKGNSVQRAGIRQAGTHLPVGHEPLNTVHSWTMSASTIATPIKSMGQPGVITPANQDEAKALLPQFYGRNQFATDAARGNIEMVRRFIAAYPETDAGPSEYSPSPLKEAAKNGHLDVVEALIPKASGEVRIDTLCAVCWAGTDEEQQTKLAPIVKALAQSVKKKDNGDVLNAATDPIRDPKHSDWIFETLVDAWIN
jgi:hypothetical protein